jgi:hypothetical protein
MERAARTRSRAAGRRKRRDAPVGAGRKYAGWVRTPDRTIERSPHARRDSAGLRRQMGWHRGDRSRASSLRRIGRSDEVFCWAPVRCPGARDDRTNSTTAAVGPRSWLRLRPAAVARGRAVASSLPARPATHARTRPYMGRPLIPRRPAELLPPHLTPTGWAFTSVTAYADCSAAVITSAGSAHGSRVCRRVTAG